MNGVKKRTSGKNSAPEPHSTRLAEFRKAHRALAAFLETGAAIPQGILDWIRRIHAAPTPLPARMRVDTKTGKGTELPCRGKFRSHVKDIRIADCLSWACLNSVKKQSKAGKIAVRTIVDTMARYLLSRISASEYSPRLQTLGETTFAVHNGIVTLKHSWSVEDLADLRRALSSHGVFEQVVPDQRTGLACTCLTDTNPDMGCRQWVTDSCMAGLTQRLEAPDMWWRSLVVNSGFHITRNNLAAVFHTVRDPNWYRQGEAKCGVAHIFLPRPKNSADEGLQWDEVNQVPLLESIKEDPLWGNRKRLESQALLVYWLAQTLVAGAYAKCKSPATAPIGAAWGFPWDQMTEMQKRYVIKGLQALSMYLLAVQWNGKEYDFQAPSVSSWEEAPFAGGCASDTGFMVDAARALRSLLFDRRYSGNAIIEDVRQRLCGVTSLRAQGTNAEKLLSGSPFADFRHSENLDHYIAAGERFLAKMVIEPVLTVWHDIAGAVASDMRQFKDRGPDTSLALLAAYHSSFAADPLCDAAVRLNIVQFLEATLMDRRPQSRFGMRRYGAYHSGGHLVFDSYLNLFFHFALVLPGLFIPGFSALVEEEQFRRKLHRPAGDAASPRDNVMSRAYAAYVAARRGPVRSYKDAQNTAGMELRQHLSLPIWTAQWSIGPTACVIALAVAKIKALAHVQANGRDQDATELLSGINSALARFINLSSALIVEDTDASGQCVYRADGTVLPKRFNSMEAFQACRDVDGTVRWIPGDHTLPWSAAQLHEGLRLAQLAAELEEETLWTQ